MINYGTIYLAKNNGDLKAVSTSIAPDEETNYQVIVGGIACVNYFVIEKSINFAKVVGEGDSAYIIAGGIAATNMFESELSKVGSIINSKAVCDIVALSKQNMVYAGGVVAQSTAAITYSGFEGNISAHSNLDNENTIHVFAGGVVAYNNSYYNTSLLQNCYADVNYIEPTQNKIENENETVNNIYAGVAGFAGYVENFLGMLSNTFKGQNNHFVNKESLNSIGYWFVYDSMSGALSGLQKATANSTVFIEHDTFDQIPKEVIPNV